MIVMKYSDNVVNLFFRQYPDPEYVLQNAYKNEVCCILTGSDHEENQRVVDYVSTHPGVYGTTGIHPHQADHMTETAFEYIRSAQQHTQIVAVGECGLDYDRMFSTKQNQIRCLERHMEIAFDTGKPMFLHERSALQDLAAMFHNCPSLCSRSVVHCFTGNRQQLSAYLDMGFMIGITGWICDAKRAGDLRDAVSFLPMDRVMIETDAPYLTPKNVPGLNRVNVPENIRYIAHDLSHYMQVPEEDLIRKTLSNTAAFFGISL